MNLTKINTFWRQIARIRAGVAYNNNTHTHTPGDLSYTAQMAARNEPTKGGNNDVVVWVYWKHEHGSMVAKREEVIELRKRCKDYTGITVNGEELFVCDKELVEEMKNTQLLCVVGVYDLKLFN